MWSRLSLCAVTVTAVIGCSSESSSPPDPLAPLDSVSGLADVSADLREVLEHGTLPGACAKLQSDDRLSRLRCGKEMFFYESFGMAGAPTSLVQFLIDNFPDEIGPGFSKLGLITDPDSPRHLPLGLVKTAKLGGKIDALAFSCASCHFGQLPDGRYAVGAPNVRYKYGQQILALLAFPEVALQGPGKHDATVLSVLAPMVQRFQSDASLKNKLLLTLLPFALSGVTPITLSVEGEKNCAAWAPGTMDFLMEPLPINDGVHIVSRIPALWELPSDHEIQTSGMTHAMLGWGGNVTSLMRFCSAFVAFGGGRSADWPESKLAPLAEYLYSLRRPRNPTPPSVEQAARGRALFADKGCLACHSGPRGSGKRVYSYEEIGTDPAMARWLDPSLSGETCCGAPVAAGEHLTHGIKSPRLTGAWAFGRFLHNGAVASLEELFCLDRTRPKRTDAPFGDQGHHQTCEGLDPDDKRALIAYLLAN